MLTGVCPHCHVRRVLVWNKEVETRLVRTHECGSLLVPRDVQPLPRMRKKITNVC